MNTSLLYHSFLELETLAAPPPPLFREIFPLPAKKMFHVKRLRRRFFGGLRPPGGVSRETERGVAPAARLLKQSFRPP
ncbi:MAG TPA: hypothetical protein H9736_05120, partial [Candidatus Anaerotruncus excrementipullorum]|nr:hypothetical protein [Candidatus Anaerotruncus excrementipullorum]